jgi:UDP-N-acetylmuramyl pentapeptide phosphotransferase/UDP-N-acetylglucosamine-1-phosphate transferase
VRALAWAAVGAGAAFVIGRLTPPFGTRPNYRARPVALAGPACVALLLAGGVAVRAFATGRTARSGVVAFGAVLLAGGVGIYDDLHGDAQAKGLAGHLRALRRGRVTSGAVKMAFIGLAGVLAGLLLDGPHPRALADVVLVAGTANLLNLFDLRPGRALKVAALAALPLAGGPLGGLVCGVAAGLLPDDLRERRMLGDGGANALGAALGVALAARLRTPIAVVVAAVVVALTLASERVSFSRVVDAVAPLRWADRLGRRA